MKEVDFEHSCSLAFGGRGAQPSGLAGPVPRVHWGGLLRGLSIDKGAPVSEAP